MCDNMQHFTRKHNKIRHFHVTQLVIEIVIEHHDNLRQICKNFTTTSDMFCAVHLPPVAFWISPDCEA